MAYNPAFAPVSSSALMAANELIGSDRKNENRAFLLCKSLDRNPETCLNTGEQVTKCVMSTFDKVNKTAKPEFEAFRDCLASNENRFKDCKSEQSAFKAAMGQA